MTYNEIEKKAKDWFGQQPMGSAVRQSGPAAMEGYMAGYKNAHTDFIVNELDTYINKAFNDKLELVAKHELALKQLQERSISAPEGKKLRISTGSSTGTGNYQAQTLTITSED